MKTKRLNQLEKPISEKLVLILDVEKQMLNCRNYWLERDLSLRGRILLSKGELISTLTYLSLDVKMIFHHKTLLYQLLTLRCLGLNNFFPSNVPPW